MPNLNDRLPQIALNIGSMPPDEQQEAITYVQAYIEQLEGEYVMKHTPMSLNLAWNPKERNAFLAYLSLKWKDELKADKFIRDLEASVRRQIDVARQTMMM